MSGAIQSFFEQTAAAQTPSPQTHPGQESSPAQKVVRRAQTPFERLLASILGRSKPVARVREGREVSFDKIPFYDTAGSRLKLDSNGEQVQVRRAGRPARRGGQVTDPVLRRELALSRNRGVAQAIPQFGSRARRHLKQTEDLRTSILGGQIATPGNKSDLLRRKLEEMMGKEEFTGVDAEWMAQVKAHLKKMNGGAEKELLARAAAMAEAKMGSGEGKDAKEGKASGKEVELQDPRQPRVKKFNPSKVERGAVTVRTGEVRDEDAARKAAKKLDGEQQTTNPKVIAKNAGAEQALNQAGAQRTQGAPDAREGKQVVSRITFQKEEPAPKAQAPGEADSRSLQLLRELKRRAGGGEAAGDDPRKQDARAQRARAQDVKAMQGDTARQESPDKGASAAKTADESVKQMRSSGWRVHTPDSDAAAPQRRSGRPRTRGGEREGRDSRRVEGARAREGAQQTRSAAQSAVKGAEQGAKLAQATTSSGSSDLTEAVQQPQKAHQPNQANTSAQQAAQPQDARENSAQQASRGLQNLDEVMRKLSTNARITSGGGETRMSVRLKPPSLGTMHVRIQEQDGKYRVTLRVESAEAAKVVEQQMPQIRDHLAQQGIDVQRMDVQHGQDREQDFNREFTRKGGGKNGGENGGASAQDGTGQENEGGESAEHRSLNLGTNTMEMLAK